MIFREKWDHLASKRSDVCLPHSSDLTNHRNRALNYQKVCRFLCSRSPNTCLFLKINSSCAGGFNVNFNVGVHEQQKKSENVYLLMFSPCFIFYVAFSLLFPVKMLIWIETSHGQSMFCFLKVWLLIGCLVFFSGSGLYQRQVNFKSADMKVSTASNAICISCAQSE